MRKKALILLFLMLNITSFSYLQSLDLNSYGAKGDTSPYSALSVRGVWVSPGFFGPDKVTALEKIKSTLDEYKQSGINTVIVLVKDTSGYVFFQSKIGMIHPDWNWDFLEVFMKEAHKRNMQVHPWFCVFPEKAIVGKVREHPDWLIQGPRRELVGSLNPAIPAVRDYEKRLMIEVVTRYKADWIHLDYIRFPCEPTEPYFSFDPETRRLFKEYSGVDLGSIKARDSGNIIWNEWLEWNRAQVTQFIRELRQLLKALGREIKISAAVFPDVDNARVLIGQDWAAWIREELVDMLCPMLYTNDSRLFEKYTRKALTIVGKRNDVKTKCQVCPGIGIGTSHNQNTPEGMLEQIRISKLLDADGVVFFSSSSLKVPFLDKLK